LNTNDLPYIYDKYRGFTEDVWYSRGQGDKPLKIEPSLDAKKAFNTTSYNNYEPLCKNRGGLINREYKYDIK
jgi:hypothetical protein